MERAAKILIPRWLQLIIVPIAALVLLWFVRESFKVIVLFLIGTLLAFALDPLVRRLENASVPRWLAVLIVFLVFILILIGILSWAVPYLVQEIKQLIGNFGTYSEVLRGWYDGGLRWFEGFVPHQYQAKISEIDVMPKVESTITGLLSGLLDYGMNVVSVLLDSILIAVIAVWLLLDMEGIRKGLRKLYPVRYEMEAAGLVGDVKVAMLGYLKGQAILSIVIGVPVGIAMAVMGLPYAVLLGLWAAITELIPYLGPFLGAAPAVIIAFVDQPAKAIFVIILFAIIQQLESLYLAPRIMGDKLGVHPLIVMFALIAGGQIAGILGMLLSAPILAICKVILEFWRENVQMQRWSLKGDKGSILDQLTSD